MTALPANQPQQGEELVRQRVHRLIALLAALALTATAVMPASAIVYGQPTGGLYPNVGALIAEFDVEGEPLKFIVCTGTLVDDGDHDGSSNLFLTAAHCIFDEQVWVSFDDDIDTDPTKFDSVVPGQPLIAGTATPHERFACCGANDTFDIAMVELEQEVAIAPAQIVEANQLSDMTNADLRSERFTAVGYGTVRETRTKAWQSIIEPEGIRSYATQSALSLTKAWLTLSMNEATSDGGTCFGDSGGPHFMEDGTLASITVTGDMFCKATDKTYRLDTPVAQEFLARFIPAG